MQDTTPRLSPEALARLGTLEWRARTIVEGFLAGQHRSPYHGYSVEFAEHRAYNPGDPLRHIDWKVLAKTDRLYVKRFEEETNLRHLALLDTSGSMRYAGAGPTTKLAYGALLCAALHTLLVRQRDATGLATFDDGVQAFVPPRARRTHLAPLLAALDNALEAPATPRKTAAAQSLTDVAERLPRRSLVTVVTDLYENVGEASDLQRALRLLRTRGHEVVVFHVLDAATEARLEVDDRPTTFVDAETGERLTTNPADIREAYRAAMDGYVADFRRACHEQRIDVVTLDTATPFDVALAAYLHARRRVAG